VVAEGAVLLRIQNLKHGRSRVAPEIAGHFIYFVQQEKRINRARLAHMIDYFTGQRTDICAPVTADFSLVPNAAQRHPDKAAPKRFGNRTGNGGFSNARRADKAEYWAVHAFCEGVHR